MNRKELIEKLQDKLQFCTHTQVEDGVKSTLQLITNALNSRERVEIRGFGSLTMRNSKLKLARNPKTGTIVEVPAKRKIHFKRVLQSIERRLRMSLN